MKRWLGPFVVVAFLLSLACGPPATNPDGQQDGKGLPEIPRASASSMWPSEVHSRLQIPDSALPKGLEIVEAGPMPMISSLELPGEVVGDEEQGRPGRAVPSGRNRVVEVGSGPVFIRVLVPIRDLAFVREGQEARIDARTFGRKVFGQVVSVGMTDGQTTLSAPALIVVGNPGGGRWWPGLDVTVSLVKESFVAAVAVSRSALQNLEGGAVVFVRSGDSFEVRPVTVGRSDDDLIEIKSGLAVGERYAATNSDLVRVALRKGEPSPQP